MAPGVALHVPLVMFRHAAALGALAAGTMRATRTAWGPVGPVGPVEVQVLSLPIMGPHPVARPRQVLAAAMATTDRGLRAAITLPQAGPVKALLRLLPGVR